MLEWRDVPGGSRAERTRAPRRTIVDHALAGTANPPVTRAPAAAPCAPLMRSPAALGPSWSVSERVWSPASSRRVVFGCSGCWRSQLVKSPAGTRCTLSVAGGGGNSPEQKASTRVPSPTGSCRWVPVVLVAVGQLPEKDCAQTMQLLGELRRAASQASLSACQVQCDGGAPSRASPAAPRRGGSSAIMRRTCRAPPLRVVRNPWKECFTVLIGRGFH